MSHLGVELECLEPPRSGVVHGVVKVELHEDAGPAPEGVVHEAEVLLQLQRRLRLRQKLSAYSRHSKEVGSRKFSPPPLRVAQRTSGAALSFARASHSHSSQPEKSAPSRLKNRKTKFKKTATSRCRSFSQGLELGLGVMGEG